MAKSHTPEELRALEAAMDGQTNVLRAYLKNKGNPNLRSIDGDWSLMMHAAYFGHAKAVRLLLDHMADPNLRDPVGTTPLLTAVSMAFQEPPGGPFGQIVRLLCERGADVNASDSRGLNPILSAAEGGNADVLRTLLDFSASVSVKNRANETPLEVAKRLGRHAVAAMMENLALEEAIGKVDNKKSAPGSAL